MMYSKDRFFESSNAYEKISPDSDIVDMQKELKPHMKKLFGDEWYKDKGTSLIWFPKPITKENELEFIATILYKLLLHNYHEIEVPLVRLYKKNLLIEFKNYPPYNEPTNKPEDIDYKLGLGQILAAGLFIDDIDVFGSYRSNILYSEDNQKLIKIDAGGAFGSFLFSLCHKIDLLPLPKESILKSIHLPEISISTEKTWNLKNLNSQTRKEFCIAMENFTTINTDGLLDQAECELERYDTKFAELDNLKNYLKLRQQVLREKLSELQYLSNEQKLAPH